jgi:hypothetical protein
MNYAKSGGLLAAAALLSLGLLPAIASAQTQDTSVADAARKAREQKKTAPKAARTLTNDDLPAAPAATPAEAKPAAAPSEPADTNAKPAETDAAAAEKKAAADKQAADEKQTTKKAELEAALKHAKALLAENEHELDVLNRLQVLDSDSHYSQTGYQADTAGKAKLDADAQQISDKKVRIEDIKTKIADLIAELGTDPDAKNPAADQPPPKQ